MDWFMTATKSRVTSRRGSKETSQRDRTNESSSVPRLVFAPRALDDLDRLTDFLLKQSPELAKVSAPIIVSGLQALKVHPLIGRQIEHGLRELMISRGRTGYVA